MRTDRPIKDFLAEAEDILETANQTLLSLETEQAAGRTEPEQVERPVPRRSIPSRGSPGMFGLKAPVGAVRTSWNSCSTSSGSARSALGRQVLDVLFETVALLGRLVQQAAGKQPFEDISRPSDRIDAVLKAKPPAAERPVAARADRSRPRASCRS